MEIKQTTCRKQRFNLLGQHMIWQLQKHRHCRSNFLQKIAHGVNVHHNICLVYTKFNALSYIITSYKLSFFLGAYRFTWLGDAWCTFAQLRPSLLKYIVYAYSHCISYFGCEPVPTCSNNHFFQRSCTWVKIGRRHQRMCQPSQGYPFWRDEWPRQLDHET